MVAPQARRMSGDLHVDARLARGAFTLNARFEAPGEGVTALFGPSGAGKSLALSMIAGLKAPEAGRIALGGRVLDDVAAKLRTPPHARGIGLVFQDARLFPHLDVRANLAYALRRAPRQVLPLEDVAARFDIAALFDRPVRNLSGGEKSRVALARALLSAPELLLLDEPFAALDGARRAAFLATLQEMFSALMLPMLVVTHQIEDVATIATHVVAMQNGAVVAQGPLAETVVLPAFQALLARRDLGAALPAAVLRRGGAGGAPGAVWLRADHVLIASEPPRALSARNVFEGAIESIEPEHDAARLVRVRTEHGPVLARITEDAEADLALTPGKAVWAIVKAHAL